MKILFMKMSVSYPDDLSYDNIKHSDSEAMNKWRTEAINIILEEKEKGSYEARIDFFPITNQSIQKTLALELAERFPISISHKNKRSPVIKNENHWISAENNGYLDMNGMIAINVRIRN